MKAVPWLPSATRVKCSSRMQRAVFPSERDANSEKLFGKINLTDILVYFLLAN